jgi:hypothetical protein
MASDQIRQMVNFILQEAHEKANEIRVKVSFFVCVSVHDINIMFVVCIEALVWSGGHTIKMYEFTQFYALFTEQYVVVLQTYKCTRCDHFIIFPPPPILTILPTPSI